jgi:TATA-box binding protein (TBP) (component of TFIID and TFIIIB)
MNIHEQNIDNYVCMSESDEIIDYINIESFNMHLLPENVEISTMSLRCYFGTPFLRKNIFKYIILDDENIIAVKSPDGMRCIKGFETRFKSTKTQSDKNFHNQNTIIVKVRKEKYANIKLFKNGSIQMTGCKYLSDGNIVINKLIKKLYESVYVQNSTNPEMLDEIKFVKDVSKLSVNQFQIDLINSDFAMNYLNKKESLFELLKSYNILCRLFEKHSCVNVKYKVQNYSNKKNAPSHTYVSIFVFQTGKIIITGAKTPEHVKNAYRFIVKFMNTHKHKIIKNDLNTILNSDYCKEIIDLYTSSHNY